MLADAGEKLGEVLSQVELMSRRFLIMVANVTAQYVKNAAEVKELLTRQVSSSVRWQQSVEAMIADGGTPSSRLDQVRPWPASAHEENKQGRENPQCGKIRRYQ